MCESSDTKNGELTDALSFQFAYFTCHIAKREQFLLSLFIKSVYR